MHFTHIFHDGAVLGVAASWHVLLMYTISSLLNDYGLFSL